MTPGAPSDLVGQTLMGKLRVERVLGAGGMGTVYEVEHLITRHRRALKVLHAQSRETVARFIREAGVAGTLRTPYVVETYDAGTLEEGGAAYVLMELLRGQSLAAAIEARDDLSVGRVCGIACQVLEGLAVAHDAGIVHRDVKPDNLFLVRDAQGRERVKILDFGISKFVNGAPHDYAGTLTGEGTMLGTPYYMSPEQASGAKDVDARTDLYSLGVILYEAFAGARPFDGRTLAALVIRIHKGDCEPLKLLAPHLPDDVVDAIACAMSPDRDARFPSARAMLAALRPFADGAYVASLETLPEVAPERASPSSPRMPGSTPARAHPAAAAVTIQAGVDVDQRRSAMVARSRGIVAATALAMLLVGGLVVWAMTSAGEPAIGERETAPAETEPALHDALGATIPRAPDSPEAPGATAAAEAPSAEPPPPEPPATEPPPPEPPATEPTETATTSPERERSTSRASRSTRTRASEPTAAPRGTGRTIERDNPYY